MKSEKSNLLNQFYKKAQYLVGPPLLLITALIRRGMLPMYLRQSSFVNL